MDWQTAFNIVAGMFATVGGWLMKLVLDDVRDLKNKQDRLPEVYARRDDVKDMKEELLAYLGRIESKLDKHG